jgi:hypothetical protein
MAAEELMREQVVLDRILLIDEAGLSRPRAKREAPAERIKDLGEKSE